MADGDIVRRVTITATGEGIDSTTRSVESLGDAVGSVSSSTDLLSTALAGFGAFGAAAGFLNYVAQANKELADMATTAEQAGLSVRDFQSVTFAGQVKGLSLDEANAGLSRSAQLLNDAQRNANSLSKEFEANGLSIKNANGQLISETQLLQIAGDLVRRAQTPQDQIAIAQMLGFTKEWIPFLEQASHGFDGIRSAAESAGAVISDETIEKAKDFDERWRKSSVEWSTYMKAAISELLPEVDKYIDKAASFIKETRDRAGGASDPARAVVESAASEALKAAGVDPQKGIVIDTEAFERASHEFNNSPIFSTETWSTFGRALWDGFGYMSQKEASEKIRGVAAGLVNEPRYPTASEMDAAFDKANPPDPGSRAKPLTQFGLTASDYESPIPSRVASKDLGSNAIDRATESLTKYSKTTLAAAESVGTTADNIERLKAMALLEAAAEKEGVSVTGQRAKAFQELAQQAGDAALALEKAKVANQINFSRQTALLTPQDAQIASTLKNIYPDVTTALNSSEAAQIRMNNAIKEFSSTSQDAARGFALDFEHALAQGKSSWDSFAAAGTNALNKIADKLTSMAVDQLWSKAFPGGGGGGGGLLSLFGLGSNATDGVGGYGPTAPPGYANGTDDAPGGWSIVGENGPEFMNVPKGAQILPNGVTPGGSVSAPVSVTIDARGADEAGLARVQAQLADLKASLPNVIVNTVTKAKQTRRL
ncbi:hypothetical protein [Bradyrhizobium sp. LA2.1]|uniref:hypothetical protein n=1 Tax=Bradyrhizobium sp. LA2.1 TaxID=3156376 RepID=UPI0033944C78